MLNCPIFVIQSTCLWAFQLLPGSVQEQFSILVFRNNFLTKSVGSKLPSMLVFIHYLALNIASYCFQFCKYCTYYAIYTDWFYSYWLRTFCVFLVHHYHLSSFYQSLRSSCTVLVHCSLLSTLACLLFCLFLFVDLHTLLKWLVLVQLLQIL